MWLPVEDMPNDLHIRLVAPRHGNEVMYNGYTGRKD